ncbi:MAG: NAD(P)-dependent oxidoreductase [Lachnospiraceae bacterium]|nr:NAD(P)-dependent oxidoreductase [Lachnospiraceae bacterium]
MKVLVTGAKGYIGLGVVRELLDRGVDVIAADFNLDGVDERAVKVEGNLFQIENPFEAFGKPDVLIHLAWRDGFKHNSINHINDFPGHYMFLSKMLEGGLKHMAVLGSMHEVGFFEGSINENTPTNPQSNYGVAKNALRQSIELLKKDRDFIFQWLRGFYIVGNMEHGCSIFSKIYEAQKNGQKKFPFTTGENQYDFIDYDEFCRQVVSAALQDKVTGIINCCSGRPMRLSERVEKFIKDNNFDIELEYGAFPDRPYDSKAIWGNNEKINQIMENESK